MLTLHLKNISFSETTVFAKKAIPSRTQFGPLEGVLLVNETGNLKREPTNSLLYLIETEGSVYRLDVSDESKYGNKWWTWNMW